LFERFSSFKTNPQVKGQTVGTWQGDGTNVVVRWNIWNNLVCRGQLRRRAAPGNDGRARGRRDAEVREAVTMRLSSAP
jgi:hypothetical protein